MLFGNKNFSLFIKILLIIFISGKLISSVMMLFSSNLFRLLSPFCVYSLPYILARSYSKTENGFLITFVLLILIIIGWIATLAMIIIIKKSLSVYLFVVLLTIIDICSIILSLCEGFEIGKIIAILFNGLIIFFISLNVMLKKNIVNTGDGSMCSK